MAMPFPMLTSVPVWRVTRSPLYGRYSRNEWLITPLPLVRVTRSLSKPISPRVGISAVTVTPTV